MPRLSIGSARLGFAGTMTGGSMRQSLYRGVLNGTVTTDKGTVRFSAYVAATRPVIVVEWTTTDAERAELSFVPMAQSRSLALPDVSCVAVGGGSVCTQPLACGSYSTAVLSKTATAPLRGGGGGGGGGRGAIGIGNQQRVKQYPPNAGACRNSSLEALAAARATLEVKESVLLEEHTAWWAGHWEASALVSVPDTVLEGFYAIQTFKLGAAYRAEGVPIIDQQGPFKADCAGYSWLGLDFNHFLACSAAPCHAAPRAPCSPCALLFEVTMLVTR